MQIKKGEKMKNKIRSKKLLFAINMTPRFHTPVKTFDFKKSEAIHKKTGM